MGQITYIPSCGKKKKFKKIVLKAVSKEEEELVVEYLNTPKRILLNFRACASNHIHPDDAQVQGLVHKA